MDMKINFKRSLKVNGIEYTDPDAMPPEIRRLYDRAMASSGSPGVQGGIETHITFNSKTYGSRDEMPPSERALYDAALAALAESSAGEGVQRTAEFSAANISAEATGPKTGGGSFLRITLVGGGLLLLLWIVVAVLKGSR